MSTNVTDVDYVIVVGGGDIGLLTGLSIKQLNPDIGVSIVDNFDEDPPEVGKSTYYDITDTLHGFLDIPRRRFLSEVKPIWKGSVYFRDWCDCDPFHHPFDEDRKYVNWTTPNSVEYLYHLYDEVHADPEHRTPDEAMAEEGKSALMFEPREGYVLLDSYAYHLDLNRFNSFLRTLCQERGIVLVDDEITSVESDGTNITEIRSDECGYEADLYVDATGFGRILKRELDDTFREFDLPLDAAFSAKTERPLSDVVSATVVESGDYGWFWQIDTYEYRDMGYVFASEFVSDEDAAAEFVDHCDGAISTDDLAKHEFNSGYYENAWQGNCVAIGNTEGFVEPIQSTGLTANAQAGLELSHVLAAQNGMSDAGRAAYNNSVSRIWESIYDFVCVHYRYASGSNEFWETMQDIPVSQRVETLIRSFDERGFDTALNPLADDSEVNDLKVFDPINFYRIMHSMGAESSFYEDTPVTVSDEVREDVEDTYESMADEADQLMGLEEVYRAILPEMNEFTPQASGRTQRP